MFIYKTWKEIKTKDSVRWMCSGWFLFGVIPLVIWKTDIDIPKR